MESQETEITVLNTTSEEDLNLIITNSFVTEDYDATEELLAKSNSIHSCKVCEEVYRSKSDLVAHMKASYDCRTKKVYRCVQCLQVFHYVGKLQLHLLSHTQENTEEPSKADEEQYSEYVCELCGKDFVNQTEKTNHIDSHFEQRGSVLCPICGKCIGSKEMYHRHRVIHGIHSKSTEKKLRKKYQCQICQEQFTGSRFFKDHLKVHTGDHNFECGDCGKIFSKKNMLRVHVKAHMKKKSKIKKDKSKLR